MVEHEHEQASKAHTLFVSAGYAFCSATLIVINKWALLYFPFSATLTAAQFGFSALVAFVLGILGFVEVDALRQSKVIAFLPAVVLFYVSIASNLKLLHVSNVDTFIVTRSLTPIITNKFEQAYLGSRAPPWKATLALMLIVFGALLYGYAERDNMVSSALFWAVIYICAMTVDSVFIKKVVTDVQLTRWGMVYYNNFLAFLMFPLGSLVTGEYKNLFSDGEGDAPSMWDSLSAPGCAFPVALSCLMGVAISYFALNCRKALTATSFTVLAVTNKFATVLINTTVWTHHAGPLGILSLLVCISGGIVYSEAMKAAKTENKDVLPLAKAPPRETK